MLGTTTKHAHINLVRNKDIIITTTQKQYNFMSHPACSDARVVCHVFLADAHNCSFGCTCGAFTPYLRMRIAVRGVVGCNQSRPDVRWKLLSVWERADSLIWQSWPLSVGLDKAHSC